MADICDIKDLGLLLRAVRDELIANRAESVARRVILDDILRELRYQGSRLSAIEKRFGTLVTTTLCPELSAKGRGVRDPIRRNPWDIQGS